MNTALLPLRRIAVQYVVFAAVVAAGGVADSWGSSLALIVLVACAPFGVWGNRSKRPLLRDPLDALTPASGVLESPGRTALRTLSVMGLFAIAVVIGVFQPLFGSLGGGVAAGIAASRLLSLRRLLRMENRLGCRLIVEAPAQIFLRNKMLAPVYFRDRP